MKEFQIQSLGTLIKRYVRIVVINVPQSLPTPMGDRRINWVGIPNLGTRMNNRAFITLAG